MIDSLHSEDPGSTVLPYTLSGGTDNKSLSRLGITGYGFAPLQLPADLDFTGQFAHEFQDLLMLARAAHPSSKALRWACASAKSSACWAAAAAANRACCACWPACRRRPAAPSISSARPCANPESCPCGLG